MAKTIRLDKLLSEMGLGTRSEVKNLIKKGTITVNGTVSRKPEEKIDPVLSQICHNGRPITYEAYEYYLFHKPAGCVTATKDVREKTVMDYLTHTLRRDLFPVGRLDKDTEGLLLITNDGDLAHRLLSPNKHVPKTYYARVAGVMTESMIPDFQKGLDIGDATLTQPSTLQVLTSGEESEILLTITEGRYHQVKRMVQAMGGKVTYLKRLTMGSLRLDDTLSPGDYRRLTLDEIDSLKNQ